MTPDALRLSGGLKPLRINGDGRTSLPWRPGLGLRRMTFCLFHLLLALFT
jgi:hypothetical protein